MTTTAKKSISTLILILVFACTTTTIAYANNKDMALKKHEIFAKHDNKNEFLSRLKQRDRDNGSDEEESPDSEEL